MPLTISHPAASLPFRRLGLNLSALVVGSMAPDFAKFATLSPGCNFGHSWLGILWFCIPAGLVVLWIFHSVAKYPLFTLLPFSHQRRLAPVLNSFSFTSRKQQISILCGLIIDASTHLVWDSFTHNNGAVTNLLPILRSEIFEIASYSVKPYTLLQHGSTLAGFALLVFWYSRWFRKTSENDVDSRFLLSQKTKTFVTLTLIGFALMSGVIYGGWSANNASEMKVLKIFLGRGVVAFGATLAFALLIYCIIWRWKSFNGPTDDTTK